MAEGKGETTPFLSPACSAEDIRKEEDEMSEDAFMTEETMLFRGPAAPGYPETPHGSQQARPVDVESLQAALREVMEAVGSLARRMPPAPTARDQPEVLPRTRGPSVRREARGVLLEEDAPPEDPLRLANQRRSRSLPPDRGEPTRPPPAHERDPPWMVPPYGYPWGPMQPPVAVPAAGREPDRRRPRIPRDFEGKEEVWEDYLHHFLGVAAWNGWGERDKADGLYISLKGAAADLVYNTPDSHELSFRQMCRLLEGRYGVDRCLTADKRALKKRTKQKGETYSALGDDVIRLARRVYKDSPELAEREGKDAYIQALPHNLRLPVAASNPATVGDCVEIVERLCSVLDTSEGGAGAKVVRRVDGDSKGKGNAKKKPSQNETGKKDRPNVFCWDCGRSGHIRTSCPEHFKYKPKGTGDPQNPNVGNIPSSSPPAQQEGNDPRPQ